MWLFLGLLIGIALVMLVLWLRRRKLSVSWYEWLLALAGLALLLFAFQNYRTSIAEYETVAAGMLLLIFGVPGIVLLAIAFVLVLWRRFRKARVQPTTDTAAG